MTNRTVSCGPIDQRVQYTTGNWTQIDNDSTTSFLAVNQATVIFNFNGTSVSVLGSLDSDAENESSNLTYILDGITVPFDHTKAAPGMVYISPVLPDGSHQLQLVSANETRLSIRGMVLTAEDVAPKLPVGAIVGGVLGCLALLGVIITLVVLKRRRSRQRAFVLDGPLQATLPSSKEAFTSRNYSNYGLSFYSTSSSENFDSLTHPPPRVQTRTRSSERKSSSPLRRTGAAIG